MLPLQLKAQRFGTLLAALSPGETHKQAIPCNWDHKGVEGPLEKGLSVGNPMRHEPDCKFRRSFSQVLKCRTCETHPWIPAHFGSLSKEDTGKTIMQSFSPFSFLNRWNRLNQHRRGESMMGPPSHSTEWLSKDVDRISRPGNPKPQECLGRTATFIFHVADQ